MATNCMNFGIPCPFLEYETNACLIYEARPFICRTYGVSYCTNDIPGRICSKIESIAEIRQWGLKIDSLMTESMFLVSHNLEKLIFFERAYPLVYHLLDYFKKYGLTIRIPDEEEFFFLQEKKGMSKLYQIQLYLAKQSTAKTAFL